MTTLANIRHRLLKALPIICLFNEAGNGALGHVPSGACEASVTDMPCKPHPASTPEEDAERIVAIAERGLATGRKIHETCVRGEARLEVIRQELGLPPFGP